jgi:hypothetical protein
MDTTLTLAERMIELANITISLVDKVNDISVIKPSTQCINCEVPVYNGSCDLEVLNNWILDLDTWFTYN